MLEEYRLLQREHIKHKHKNCTNENEDIIFFQLLLSIVIFDSSHGNLKQKSNNEGKTHSYALSDWQLFHCIIILFCIYGEGINIQCLACDLETKENGEILYGTHMNWELFSY